MTLADTSCGYGCIAHLPEGATGFTTIELKSNFLGTAREGTLDCVATAQHPRPHDAGVGRGGAHRETGKTIALFRCTADDPVAAIGLTGDLAMAATDASSRRLVEIAPIASSPARAPISTPR